MAKVAPPNYTQVPNVILDRIAELEAVELAVVLIVCRETFGWHRSVEKLSLSDFTEATGFSRRGVQSAIASLLEREWIQRTKSGQDFTYELAVELWQPVLQSMATSATELWQPVPQPRARHIEGKKEKEKKERADERETLPTKLDSELFRSSWKEWEQHRKEKKQGLTATTRSKQLSKLAEMGESRAIVAISYSITNGWTGIFEPKSNAAKKSLPTASDWEESRKHAEELFGH